MANVEVERAIRRVFDRAIAEVADEEFARLSDGLSDTEIATHVQQAFFQLGKLSRRREMPDYDNSWVALFYLTQYQPRQVNLAYSFLIQSVRRPLSRSVRVVDVGCGALAMQFALAMFAATIGQPSATISVRGIDPSRPMRSIGRKLWNRVGDVSQEEGLADLGHLMGRMSTTCSTMASLDRDAARRVDWVTSIHAVYEGTGADLAQSMRTAADKMSPKVILATTPDFKGRVLDGVRIPRYIAQDRSLSDARRLEGRLSRVTGWQRNLQDELLWFRLSHFLSTEVEWNPQTKSRPIIRAWRTAL